LAETLAPLLLGIEYVLPYSHMSSDHFLSNIQFKLLLHNVLTFSRLMKNGLLPPTFLAVLQNRNFEVPETARHHIMSYH
jgi:hypothetical protein